MRPQLVHLSGPDRGVTRTYREANVLIGTDPDCTVRFPTGGTVAPRHAEIAYSEPDCSFFLRAHATTFVNRRQVREIQLESADLIELGAGGPRLRFHAYAPAGSVCKPVRRMLADAGDVAAESGLFAFTKSFTRDLFTHATWQLKVFFPLAVLLAALPAAWLAGWLGARRPVREMEARERARGAAVDRIHAELVRGVCLVHGIYGFQRRGRTPPEFAADEHGAPVEIEYTGSGFLVDGRGMVVTNRHVAQPWTADDRVQPLLQIGFEPHFFRLVVLFPGKPAIAVDPGGVAVRDDDLDVAMLHVEAGEVADVPVLPLAAQPARPGQRVWVLGYPTGVRALLAKADDALAERLTTAAGATMTSVIEGLAAADSIRPVVTQGALSDVLETKLVYDAETTTGGSGGPVIDEGGAVIGLTYAVLIDFTGSNFGVPIRFARDLLPR